MDASLFTFTCPTCREPLQEAGADLLRCSRDGEEYPRQDGIWHLLTRQQAAAAERFLDDYHRLRHDEGWGVGDAAYYRALPYDDTSGRHTEIWRIRAASYDLLRSHALEISSRRIVDLGAGNCWLSWRLAEAGHTVAAVDLSLDPDDGLGAARHYGKPIAFSRVQAGFDDVPIAAQEVDTVIFNGSLHYAADPRRALSEARRLLRPGGRVVIMDTPIYRRAASGQRMIRERRQAWQERYGPGFGDSPAAGFLTRGRLRDLGRNLGWRWRFHHLPLGWRWHLGPIGAVALGRREPARFPLIVGWPLPVPA